MKHSIRLILLIAILVPLCCGCDWFHKPKFDEALLAGYWVEGTVHEYYNANGTGYTWDTADDVTEERCWYLASKSGEKTSHTRKPTRAVLSV